MTILSVIIPALNEESTIGKTLEFLEGQAELIVVDGGSTDRTVEIAQSHGAKVVSSLPGRGRQMNTGVNISCGEILLFLHADTQPPREFLECIESTLKRADVAMGAFALGFNTDEKKLLNIAKAANLRSRLFHLPYGDQGYFMARSRFDTIGGFPEIEIMEDFVFVRKMRRHGKIVHLSQAVTTSSRRWQNIGVVRTTIINQLVVAGYLLGVSPVRLSRMYNRLRGVSLTLFTSSL